MASDPYRTSAPIADLVRLIQASLTPDLLDKKYRGATHPHGGHCYVATEALWFMIGSWESPWRPWCARDSLGGTHWWLQRGDEILDATSAQYTDVNLEPPYRAGKGKGFQNKVRTVPSYRAQELIRRVHQRLAEEAAASRMRMPNPQPRTGPQPPPPSFDPEAWVEPELLAKLKDPATSSAELDAIFRSEVDSDSEIAPAEAVKNHHRAVYILLAGNANLSAGTAADMLLLPLTQAHVGEILALNPVFPLMRWTNQLDSTFWSGVESYLSSLLVPVITQRLLFREGVWKFIIGTWPEHEYQAEGEAFGGPSIPTGSNRGEVVVSMLQRYTHKNEDASMRMLRFINFLRTRQRVRIQTNWESWLT